MVTVMVMVMNDLLVERVQRNDFYISLSLTFFLLLHFLDEPFIDTLFDSLPLQVACPILQCNSTFSNVVFLQYS